MKSKWENDISGGFVSVTEIKNVWIEWGRKLDKEILSGALSRDQILNFFDNLQYELYRRAKRSQEDAIRQGVDRPSTKTPDSDSETQHKDRIAAIRSRLA